jgi:hypothetical protein
MIAGGYFNDFVRSFYKALENILVQIGWVLEGPMTKHHPLSLSMQHRARQFMVYNLSILNHISHENFVSPFF